MGFILIAIVLIIGAIFLFRRMLRKTYFIDGIPICLSTTIASLGALLMIFIGVGGLGFGESEYILTETKDLIAIKQDETYVFLDEANNCYCVNDNKTTVINKKGEETSVYCTLIIGDYDKIYVEKYMIDLKMNFWTFNVMNGSEYKIYIPQSMVSE